MSSIRIPRSWEIEAQRITPHGAYLDRRRLIRTLGLAGAGLALGPSAASGRRKKTRRVIDESPEAKTRPAVGDRFGELFPAERNGAYDLGGRPLTDELTAATYNNFYEFTLVKEKVWKVAQGYSVDPWRVEVDGLVKKPRTLDLEALFRQLPLEERLYRFRCVERWAMQVPWTGYPLGKLLALLDPLGSARWVRFVSILDRDNMPGQGRSGSPWPYYEALRLDEAHNELAFVAVGIYGHGLPIQHGAPWRVVIPWKYGYKSPKSLVRIELTKERPPTFWNDLHPNEYGFYSNVDPGKPHPRWSQAQERDIGTGETRPTELFNGYAEQVAGLYDGGEV